MIKDIHFDAFNGSFWPETSELEPFFLAPAGQEWSYRGGNDGWAISVDGLFGTEHLPARQRVKSRLAMTANRRLGVSLQLDTWDGRLGQGRSYLSKGDLNKIREIVHSMHGTPLLVGTFLPFDQAWAPVREFMETDGQVPTSIEWLDELPPDVPALIEKARRS